MTSDHRTNVQAYPEKTEADQRSLPEIQDAKETLRVKLAHENWQV